MNDSKLQGHGMLVRLVSTASLSLILSLAAASTAHAAPDLDILASAGLGDELGGQVRAIDVSGDGLVLASESRGQGTLLRLDRFGERVGADLEIPVGVDDLAVDRGSGNVVIVGGDGLAVFDPGFAPLWQRSLDAGVRRRVALGELGTIAALAGDTLHVFTTDGDPLGQVAHGQDVTGGIAVLERDGLVIASGSRLRDVCDTTIDVASLAAFAFDGTRRWHAYGDATEAQLCGAGEPASTRGVSVARGDDGLVYLLAEVEGRDDIFRARPDGSGTDANNVAFDVYTDPETAHPERSAYFARFTPDGRHLVGQYFLLPAAGSVVEAREIAADEHGNVYITGAVSHSLGAADEVAVTERLDRMVGFFQVVEPDFEARRVWEQLDADGMRTEIAALVLAGDHAVTLLEATPIDGQTEGALPSGSTILQWSGGFGPVAADKRPDPETQGTFGYESGVSGSDPTCYCDADAPVAPGALLAIIVFGIAGLQRPCRRD